MEREQMEVHLTLIGARCTVDRRGLDPSFNSWNIELNGYVFYAASRAGQAACYVGDVPLDVMEVPFAMMPDDAFWRITDYLVGKGMI